jgi:hypothetical protein
MFKFRLRVGLGVFVPGLPTVSELFGNWHLEFGVSLARNAAHEASPN